MRGASERAVRRVFEKYPWTVENMQEEKVEDMIQFISQGM